MSEEDALNPAAGAVAESDGDCEVGYKSPPRSTRFSKERQPSRARRMRERQVVSLADLVNQPVEAKYNGKFRKFHPHELTMRGLLKEALNGKSGAAIAFLDQCIEDGVVNCAKIGSVGGVALYPPELSPMVAKALFNNCDDPWNASNVARVNQEHARNRAELEDLIDEARKKQAIAGSSRRPRDV